MNANVNVSYGRYAEEDEDGRNNLPHITLFYSGKGSAAPVSESIKVGIGTVSGNIGQTVYVPVTLLKASGVVDAYGMQLDYDSAALAVERIDGKTGHIFTSYHDDEEGWLKAVWTDGSCGEQSMGEGDELFVVAFKIKDDSSAGDKPVTVSNQNDPDHLTFVNIRLVEMQKTVLAGKVTVNG